jgi:hypothetical protein
MTRKAKPRRQGLGCRVAGDAHLAATDVAVGSDNIRLPSSVISELPCCSERQSRDDRAPPLYES